MSIEIDIEKYIVLKDGERIELPLKEFELLYFLSVSPGKVYSRKQLYNSIWGGNSHSKERTVDVHISHLRKKIDKNLIRNIIGVGYKLSIETINIK
jgi:two-component system alkaline phosphatase synthesis response regulator PhoP